MAQARRKEYIHLIIVFLRVIMLEMVKIQLKMALALVIVIQVALMHSHFSTLMIHILIFIPSLRKRYLIIGTLLSIRIRKLRIIMKNLHVLMRNYLSIPLKNTRMQQIQPHQIKF